MSTKKPAQLGENLLHIRPRKGEAKPQTEEEAFTATPEAEPKKATTQKQVEPQEAPTPRRRRRRLSDKKLQLNMKVDEKTLDRFIALADKEELIFGDLLKRLIAKYEEDI